MKKKQFSEMTYYINNCKIADLLRKGDISFCESLDSKDCYSIDVGGSRSGNKSIYTQLGIKLCDGALQETDTEETDAMEIDYFDMIVADTIYSLWKNECEIITPLDIYRFMAGDPDRTISASNRDKIINSVDKLASIDIIIGCKDEMEKRNVGIDRFEGKFLICDKLEKEGAYEPVRTGEKARKNKSIVRYYIKDKMPLYNYMEYTRQIIGVPIDLLDINENTNCTDDSKRKRKNDTQEVVMLKHILIRRIEVMRNSKNNSPDRRISFIRRNSVGQRKYSGILPLMGISREYDFGGNVKSNGATGIGNKKEYYTTSAWAHKKQQVIGHIIDILDSFKKIGYIEDYELEKKGDNNVKNIIIKGEIKSAFKCLNIRQGEEEYGEG